MSRRAVTGLLLMLLGGLPVLGAEAGLLTIPGKLVAGGPTSLTLTLLDDQTKQGFSGPVRVEFLAAGGESFLLFEGESDVAGRLTLPFTVPTVASGAHQIRVEAGEAIELEATVSVTSAPALLLETDKPIYQPGQTIQGRVVRLDNSLKPSSGPVEVIIQDGKGIRVARFDLSADEFGVAPFDLELASELNQGVWKIRALSDGVESTRDVRVEPYVLPRFEALLNLDRSWAVVDEPVTGNVQARYFFGKPVQGNAHLEAYRWVGEWELYAQSEGTLHDGSWQFQVPAVDFVAGVPQNGGQGTIRLDLEVTDSTGAKEVSSETLSVAQSAAVVKVNSLIPNLKPGLNLPLLITTETPGGEPLDERVELTISYQGNEGGAETHQQEIQTAGGRSQVDLIPPLGISSAQIQARLLDHDGEADIYVAASYSPSNNFLSLFRSDGSGIAQLGQQVTYQIESSLDTTTFYEVYAAGRTIFSDFSESGEFSFTITPEMLPAARVVAYQITPESEVIADSVDLETRGSEQIAVEAAFDQETVRPGDPVKVTIRTGLNRRSLVGVSIVDQSVLSLGRSRLFLEEVFEELERRFLTPLAVAVEEEPLGGGLGVPFFQPFDQPSTRETFGEAGLQVISSENLSVPEKVQRGFLEDVPINISPAPSVGGNTQAAPEEPRVRQYFPETWLWNPILLTDENGNAELELTAPDSITGWKLAAVATHPVQAGEQIPGIAFGEGELTVFQDFFVEPSLPVQVTRGERFPLQVDIFNYLDQPQQVELKIEGSDAFDLLEGSQRMIEVAPQGTASIDFPLRPKLVGEFPLQITARTPSATDAVLRPLKVVAEGFPNEIVTNSVLEAGQTTSFQPEIPAEAIPDSVSAFLNLTPSAVAQTMQGVSDLLHMPYGCGEQNMIFLAPDIEILKYLREIGELNPETRAKAENFINLGYQRELTFQTEDGGFSAFGDPPSGLWLTAFVLSTFSGAREVRDVDELVLGQAASLLLDRQNQDGSFQTDDFLIHTELLGGVANQYTMSAYVTNALAEYAAPSVTEGLEKAADYLVSNQSLISDDPYPLAIAAVALFRVGGFEQAAESFLDRLLELAIQEGPGIHWEPFPVETTGYAAQALLASNQGAGRPELQSALDWLATQRNALGGYGHSTQDTVVALRALFAAARSVNQDLHLPILVRAGDEVLLDLLIDSSNFDLLHQVSLPLDGPQIEIENHGDTSVGYQVTRRFNLGENFLPPPHDLTIDVDYDSQHIEVDDLVDVEVSLLYTGPKERTGMVIADVGIPTGFGVVQASLDVLLESDRISRAEVAGRKVIFYIDSLSGAAASGLAPTPEPFRFSFQIRALFPVRSFDTISQAYEYYDNEVRGFHVNPALQIVQGDVPAPRIDSLSESEGSGGSLLEVHGSGFLSGSLEILFNGQAAEIVQIISDSLAIVRVPNLLPGNASLQVVSEGGSSQTEDFQIREYRLLLPLYSDAQSFSGLAFSNGSAREAKMVLSAHGSDGSVTPLAPNPLQLTLQPGRQLARLASEIWSQAPEQLAPARWLDLRSDNSEVSGIFQFGRDGQLDGIQPLSRDLPEFWFPRVHQGPTAFLGRPARTSLLIVNPHNSPAQAALTLFASDGSTYSTMREISAQGSLEGDLSDFFGPQQVSSGYLRVAILGSPGGVGFARIEFGDGNSVVGMTGQEVPSTTRSWSARIASIDSFFTHLKLVNLSAEERNVKLHFFSSGEPEASVLTRTIALPAGGQLDEFANRLWDNEIIPTAGVLLGALEVEADGPGVTGNVLFGGRAKVQQAALLPLQEHLVRSVLFSQVADNAEFFTGLAFFNPNPETTRVTIELHASSGNLLGETNIELLPGETNAAEIQEFIEAAKGLVGGYVLIRGEKGIVVQEVFGDRSLQVLSAVPSSGATLAIN